MILWAIVSAGLLPAALFAFRWFLLKTDVLVGYVWKWHGGNFYPSFDIRNRSRSTTYALGNIVYTKNKGKELLAIDNKSISSRELKPGTITYLEAATVPRIDSLAECPDVEVTIRLQNEREFKGQGPGQLFTGVRRIAFMLRRRMEKASLPLTG